ncbi:MAG: hypothetical protein EHM28_09605 [Spirochaetaceae bacterium]|nr:MAG: hypothetical protein EHM28_09605 [Spirochaetaceae bacterium]
MYIGSGVITPIYIGLMSVFYSVVGNTLGSYGDTTAFNSYSLISDYYLQNSVFFIFYFLFFIGLGILGIVAGIFLKKSRTRGILLAKIYSIGEFVLVALTIVVGMGMVSVLSDYMNMAFSDEVFAYAEGFQEAGGLMTGFVQTATTAGIVLGALFGTAIPILILVFVTREKVKEYYANYGI